MILIKSPLPHLSILVSILFAAVILSIPVYGKDTLITTSSPEHRTELWQGKILTATFRAGMCFSPDGKAKGVLILRHANGDEDVYHLYGTLKNNEFELSHSSGHHFTGKLTSPGKMEGKAKLNKGLTLTMKGDRTQNVRLAAKDCAPLP